MYQASDSISRGGQAVGKFPLVTGGTPLHARHILQGAEAASPAAACALLARQSGVGGSTSAADAAGANKHRRAPPCSALINTLCSQCAGCLRRSPNRSCRAGRRRRWAWRLTHRAAPSGGLVDERAGLAAPQHLLLPEHQSTVHVGSVHASIPHPMQANKSQAHGHIRPPENWATRLSPAPAVAWCASCALHPHTGPFPCTGATTCQLTGTAAGAGVMRALCRSAGWRCHA